MIIKVSYIFKRSNIQDFFTQVIKNITFLFTDVEIEATLFLTDGAFSPINLEIPIKCDC